jgi:hypothetical protein
MQPVRQPVDSFPLITPERPLLSTGESTQGHDQNAQNQVTGKRHHPIQHREHPRLPGGSFLNPEENTAFLPLASEFGRNARTIS